MSSKKERRRRERQAAGRKKGGALMGMRSGFKNVANSVAGTSEPKKKKKSGWVGTAVTLLILAAAVALFLNGR